MTKTYKLNSPEGKATEMQLREGSIGPGTLDISGKAHFVVHDTG